jgi:hypothetical protein
MADDGRKQYRRCDGKFGNTGTTWASQWLNFSEG